MTHELLQLPWEYVAAIVTALFGLIGALYGAWVQMSTSSHSALRGGMDQFGLRVTQQDEVIDAQRKELRRAYAEQSELIRELAELKAMLQVITERDNNDGDTNDYDSHE